MIGRSRLSAREATDILKPVVLVPTNELYRALQTVGRRGRQQLRAARKG